MRPKLLDLYSCEGGAAVGYDRAGFDVYGVDLFEDFNRKRYPYPAHTGDALSAMRNLIKGHALLFDNGEVLTLSDFAVVHASPPCQHASAGTRAQDRSKYPRLIEPTRELLKQTGLPYIIENVRGADLIDPIELCGCMFGLVANDSDGMPIRLERPRRFESNVPPSRPRAHKHLSFVPVAGVYGGSRRAVRLEGETLAEVAPRDRYAAKHERHGGYVPRSKAVQQELLGIYHMTLKGMAQSVPPAYTEWIGRQINRQLLEEE